MPLSSWGHRDSGEGAGSGGDVAQWGSHPECSPASSASALSAATRPPPRRRGSGQRPARENPQRTCPNPHHPFPPGKSGLELGCPELRGTAPQEEGTCSAHTCDLKTAHTLKGPSAPRLREGVRGTQEGTGWCPQRWRRAASQRGTQLWGGTSDPGSELLSCVASSRLLSFSGPVSSCAEGS